MIRNTVFLPLVFFFLLLRGLSSSAAELSTQGTHVAHIDSSGHLFVWGDNLSGKLGIGDFNIRTRPQRVALPSGLHAVSVGASRSHTCVLLSDQSIRCWGSNESGQLGLGMTATSVGSKPTEVVEKLQPVLIGSGHPAKLVLGQYFSCILFFEGNMKCWGSNYYGQLGIESPVAHLGQKPMDMGDALVSVKIEEKIQDACAGNGFVCAKMTDQSLRCWGDFTAIGSGGQKSLGKEKDTMGKNLSPIDLGSEAQVEKIQCGAFYACALLGSGDVKCWGKNLSGVLGGGQPVNTVIGDEPGEMAMISAVAIEPGLRTTDLSCGYAHCCALLENHAIKCWGDNRMGQLGVGDLRSRGEKNEDMGTHLAYVDLGKLSQAKAIFTGSTHTCALLKGEILKCWGGNVYGQLGLGIGTYLLGGKPNELGEKLPHVIF